MIKQLTETYDQNNLDEQKHIIPVIKTIAKLMETDEADAETTKIGLDWFEVKVAMEIKDCMELRLKGGTQKVRDMEEPDEPNTFCDSCQVDTFICSVHLTRRFANRKYLESEIQDSYLAGPRNDIKGVISGDHFCLKCAIKILKDKSFITGKGTMEIR
jgi:hypothetical protein